MFGGIRDGRVVRRDSRREILFGVITTRAQSINYLTSRDFDFLSVKRFARKLIHNTCVHNKTQSGGALDRHSGYDNVVIQLFF